MADEPKSMDVEAMSESEERKRKRSVDAAAAADGGVDAAAAADGGVDAASKKRRIESAAVPRDTGVAATASTPKPPDESSASSAPPPFSSAKGKEKAKAGLAPTKGKETEAPTVYKPLKEWQVEYAAWWLAKLDRHNQNPDVFVPPPLHMPWDPAWKSAARWIVAFKGSKWSEIAKRFECASGPAMCRLSETAIAHVDPCGVFLLADIKVLRDASSEFTATVNLDVSSVEAPAVGQVVTIPHLREAGLSSKTSTFYCRDETMTLWGFLTSAGEGLFAVVGPPGIGKSTTLWHWCLHQSTLKKVLWIHLPRKGHPVVAKLHNSTIKTLTVAAEKLKSCFRSLVDDCQLVIVDGMKKNVTDEVWHFNSDVEEWGKQPALRRVVIYCASEQLNFSYLEDLYSFDTEGNDCASVAHGTSWKIEDIEKACAFPEIWDAVKDLVPTPTEMDHLDKDDGISFAIANKFFLTGGCARWFFEYSPEKVCVAIHHHINRVTDFDALVAGVNGSPAEGVITHLLGCAGENHQGRLVHVVSQYAIRVLVVKNKLKSIEHVNMIAKSLMKANPAFDGWVLELDFITQLQLASNAASKKIAVFTPSAKKKRDAAYGVWGNWIVEGVTSAVTESDVTLGNVSVVFQVGQWLIPDRYNQGAYDAAVFIAHGDKLKLRFVNVTRSDRHDINCSYMAALLCALKLNWGTFHEGSFPVVGVEFAWIRPFEKLSKTTAIQSKIVWESDVTQTAENYEWEAPKTFEIFIKRTGSW